MAHAIGLRATSFVASAALLGALVVAGLTMTIVQREIDAWRQGRSVDMVRVIEPPVEQPRPREQAPPVRPIEGADFVPVDPITPVASTVVQDNAAASYVAPTIVNAEWVRRPRDLARYYPPRPLQRGMEGRVVLDCAVSTRGALACAVVSETPANWGFGDAALRISRDYQMVPAMRDGVPIEARHRMVVPFEVR